MDNLVNIAVHEFVTVYRRRIYQLITAAVPVVILGALMFVWALEQKGDSEGPRDEAGYVDATALFTDFREQGNVSFASYPTRDEGIEALLADAIERLYVIPADYLETGVVQRVHVSAGFNIGGEFEERALRAFLLDNLSAMEQPSDVIERLKHPLNLAVVDVDSEGAPREINGPRMLFFLALSGLLFFALVFSGGMLTQGLGEEKEARIIEVLLSSVTPAQLMVEKILGLGAAGLSQILIWAGSGLIALSVLPAIKPDLEFSAPGLALTLLAIPFFVLGYLLVATLLSVLGAVTSTTTESQQLSIMVNMPLVIPVWAWLFIVENPTAGLVQFLSLFPFTAAVTVLLRIGAEAIQPWEVAASLLVLSLSVVGVMYLAPRIFSRLRSQLRRPPEYPVALANARPRPLMAGASLSRRTLALMTFVGAVAILATACGGDDEPVVAVQSPLPSPITSPALPPPVPSPSPVPSSGATDIVTVSAPAPIEGVEIEFSAGPGPSNLVVMSGLPNACWSPGPYSVSSTADRIHAVVENESRVQPDQACAEIYRTVTTRIPLATELEACRFYDVVVNGEAYQAQALAPDIKCAGPGVIMGVEPRLGQQLALELGDSVRFEDEGLWVGFLDFEEDSRCPSDVTCVDAGQATILMDVAHDDSRMLGSVRLTLRAGQPESSAASFQGYIVRLIGLEPYPVSTKKTEVKDYVAMVVVTEEATP